MFIAPYSCNLCSPAGCTSAADPYTLHAPLPDGSAVDPVAPLRHARPYQGGGLERACGDVQGLTLPGGDQLSRGVEAGLNRVPQLLLLDGVGGSGRGLRSAGAGDGRDRDKG